jgi:hypothetical protein
VPHRPFGPFKGYGSPGAPLPVPAPGFGFRFGFGFGFGIGAAAKYLNLSPAQLFQQLSSGKSLAQIAAAKGKTSAGLEQAMTAEVKKALDAAVKAKAITSARENQILNNYSARLKQEIAQKGLAGPRRGFFRGQGGRGWGPGSQAPAIPAPPKNAPAPHGGAFPVPAPASPVA